MSEKRMMLGNAAIARGVWEAGVRVSSAYPGTPSTEISEELVKYPGVYAEWAPNEKVAADVENGASISGVRSFCTMKMVGLNVAADPLYSFSYIGCNGGMVMVVADDPGLYSSQNEQDTRRVCRAAIVPVWSLRIPRKRRITSSTRMRSVKNMTRLSSSGRRPALRTPSVK